MKLFEQKQEAETVEVETPTRSAPAEYSQPLPSRMRDVSGPVVRAGFVGHGPDKQPGFIFRNEKGKVERQEVSRENLANERPAGFFRSLARFWAGGRT